MDDKEYLERLQEFAEIVPIKGAAIPREPEEDEVVTINRGGYSFQIDKNNNSTWGYEIKKMKPCENRCEHCGCQVTNQVIAMKWYHSPQEHWRKTCTSCKMTYNPITKKFDIPYQMSQQFFYEFLKKDK